jgi:hypothetical protein
MATTKPNRYVLGTTPRLKVIPLDEDDLFFEPTEVRLSVKAPDGIIYTYSGGDLTLASGYLYYIFHPNTVGWYEYESWVKDGNSLEDGATKGFEIYDNVHED